MTSLLHSILLLLLLPTTTFSFHTPPSFTTRTPTSLNCICINCERVTNCSAYHFVEERHEQPHICPDPTFTPREGSPTIHVNIRTEGSGMWNDKSRGEVIYEYDVVKCKDYVEDMGCWVRNMPEEIKKANPDFVPT